MIFGAKKDITRKETVGYYTIVEYKGLVHIYYKGAFMKARHESFDEVLATIKEYVKNR
jgi:hypothetical protein